jgi:hypothetical protein
MRKKTFVLIFLMSALVLPAMGLDDSINAYLGGMRDGYQLGILAQQTQGNATATELYNEQVLAFNAWAKEKLNETEYQMVEMPELPMPPEIYLAPVFKEVST